MENYEPVKCNRIDHKFHLLFPSRVRRTILNNRIKMTNDHKNLIIEALEKLALQIENENDDDKYNDAKKVRIKNARSSFLAEQRLI